MDDLKANILNLLSEVSELSKDVTVVAATKTQSVQIINKAIEYGITDIGENRVQELINKYPFINKEKVNIHFIGHLQTNKVKYIVDKVCLIHSVDSIKLLEEIDKECFKINKVMDVLLQVNVSKEKSKSGFYMEEIDDVLKKCGSYTNIRVKGFMTIPPVFQSKYPKNDIFDTLYKKFIDTKVKKYDNVIMRILSMGMSLDYRSAILCGSTMIRVGRSLFGEREKM